jgi:hypothetical protein
MEPEELETEELEIERGETGVRALLTLLFFIVARLVGYVLFIIILFELLYVAVTKNPPPERVRGFANRAVSYAYRIGRYLTYNEPDRPFPFNEFPPELEPPAPFEESAGAGI